MSSPHVRTTGQVPQTHTTFTGVPGRWESLVFEGPVGRLSQGDTSLSGRVEGWRVHSYPPTHPHSLTEGTISRLEDKGTSTTHPTLRRGPKPQSVRSLSFVPDGRTDHDRRTSTGSPGTGDLPGPQGSSSVPEKRHLSGTPGFRTEVGPSVYLKSV